MFFALIFLVYKKIYQVKHKNKKVYKYKNKLLSKESNIEKIFLREEEKVSSNPNLNIKIGLYENEDNIDTLLNIEEEGDCTNSDFKFSFE